MTQEQRNADITSVDTLWRSVGLFTVRYGIAGAVILAGFVILLVVGGDLGAYGFASAVGAGLSILLLNLLYRMSVSGERDREREEEARRYFDAHGIWPDEEARESIPERRWTRPATHHDHVRHSPTIR
jgi:hypothetical protein